MQTTIVNINERGIGTVDLFSNDQKIGKMDIYVKDKTLKVYHTEVDQIHQGKGFSSLLFEKLVQFARKNNLKIIPLCPYVHARFKESPELYQDVWLKNI